MTGADGIGLFRTEFQFLVSAHAARPRTPAAALHEGARGRRRQAGRLPHRRHRRRQGAALSHRRCKDEAENPAMGWRALRLSLDRSTLMKAQARALIEASGGKVLRVMFPMVSEPWEYEEARALFEEQVEWARQAHASCPQPIEFGAMLEVPSLAEMLDLLLPRDRFPVDRHQRPDPVPVRRRPRRPAAGRALRLAEPGDPALPQARGRRRRARPACRSRVCGEMGGRPLEAMALIGIGVEQFLDHSGGGRAGQGDGPLARCRGDPRRAWTSCSPSRRRTCARRLRDWARRHTVVVG